MMIMMIFIMKMLNKLKKILSEDDELKDKEEILKQSISLSKIQYHNYLAQQKRPSALSNFNTGNKGDSHNNNDIIINNNIPLSIEEKKKTKRNRKKKGKKKKTRRNCTKNGRKIKTISIEIK